jgi:sugar lactone lactonase YvrE
MLLLGGAAAGAFFVVAIGLGAWFLFINLKETSPVAQPTVAAVTNPIPAPVGDSGSGGTAGATAKSENPSERVNGLDQKPPPQEEPANKDAVGASGPKIEVPNTVAKPPTDLNQSKPSTEAPAEPKPAAPVAEVPAEPKPAAPAAEIPVEPKPATPVAQAKPPTEPAEPPAPAEELTEPAGPFTLPALSGWTMAPDGKTLIISTGSAGQLVYFDTATSKDGKTVEVDFQPTCLVAQGNSLIAGSRGSADLHVLDLYTGKEQKTIKLAGSGFVSLACHPSKGYVYAASQDGSIYSVDVKAARGWKTRGVGTMLAVDPIDGKFVYAATQHAIRDSIIVQNVGPQTQVRFGKTGQFATLVKYQVSKTELTVVGTNQKAAVNTRVIAISPDGTKLAAVGGGGVIGEGGRRAYDIPVYDAKNLENMVGQIDVGGAYPSNIAFHPVLKIGVAEKSGGDLTVFKTSSLAKAQALKVPGASPVPNPTLLMFGGQGRNIVFAMHRDLGRGRGESAQLFLLPLDLTPEQRAELKKVSQPAAAPVAEAPAEPKPATPVAQAKPPTEPAEPPAPAEELNEPAGPFTLPAFSGWAMAPDGKTLIVATGSAGQLIYFDTTTGKDGKPVEVDFQPTCLATQGNSLIAGARGSADLHVLDLRTGKEQKTIKLAGTGFVNLACHPSKGYVYAASQDGNIYSVDVKTGRGWKTTGLGTMLAVDPIDGKSIYAATQHAIRDAIIVQRVGPQAQVRFGKTGQFANLVKYKVFKTDLTLVGANQKGAVNTKLIGLSPDGTKLATVGAGGVVAGEGGRRAYDIPVYDTKNLENMVGQIDIGGAFPNNVAFHPVLKLGVAEKTGGDLTVFKTSSLAKVQALKVPGASPTPGPSVLTFGGRGRNIVFVTQENIGGREVSAKLFLLPLELTAEQRDELKRAKWASSGSP